MSEHLDQRDVGVAERVRSEVRARYAEAATRVARGEPERARAAEAEAGCCGPGGCGSGPVDVAFGAQLYEPGEAAGALRTHDSSWSLASMKANCGLPGAKRSRRSIDSPTSPRRCGRFQPVTG